MDGSAEIVWIEIIGGGAAMRAAGIHWLTWIVGSSVSAWYSGPNITSRIVRSIFFENGGLVGDRLVPSMHA